MCASKRSTRRPTVAHHHWLCVVFLLVLTAALAVTSLRTDSATFDEPLHLTAGVAALTQCDYRLSPDHPPLGRMWTALPVLFTGHKWLPLDDPAWADADTPACSVRYVYELNDGQALINRARGMMVVLLIATCLATYVLARTLFGPSAGLLALALAALSPTLLAHGRLVTTDIPAALTSVLVLLTFASVMQRVSVWRTLAAGVALAAAALTKFSWPLLLPALLLMVIWTVRQRSKTPPDDRPSPSVCQRILAVIAMMLIAWVGIWAGFGWQRQVLAPLPGSLETPATKAAFEEAERAVARDWQLALHHPDGTPRRGLVATFVRLAASSRLLPDGFVLGLARAMHQTTHRNAYLLGECSDTGWYSYFPIAFAVKTPLPVLLFMLAGAIGLIRGAALTRDRVLWVGVLVFGVVYAAYVIQSRVNIGHRHLLPLYPCMFAIAGVTAYWWQTRWGRAGIVVGLLWLLGVNLWIHPNYLAFFNSAVGGPANGYRILADSNVDWGQDLLRLRDYAERYPDQPLKLAWFGSVPPTCYVNCTALPSFRAFGPPADLTGGIYVVSVNQRLGVYDEALRPGYWTRARQAELAELRARESNNPRVLTATEQARLDWLERHWLVHRLSLREPDARVGYSLFVYHLDAAEAAILRALPTFR